MRGRESDAAPYPIRKAAVSGCSDSMFYITVGNIVRSTFLGIITYLGSHEDGRDLRPYKRNKQTLYMSSNVPVYKIDCSQPATRDSCSRYRTPTKEGITHEKSRPMRPSSKMCITGR